jgi:hypothetical protein
MHCARAAFTAGRVKRGFDMVMLTSDLSCMIADARMQLDELKSKTAYGWRYRAWFRISQFWVWFEPGGSGLHPLFPNGRRVPLGTSLNTAHRAGSGNRQRTLGDAVVQTDVTKLEQVKRLVDRAVQSHGRIDVILSNAGLMPFFPLSVLR